MPSNLLSETLTRELRRALQRYPVLLGVGNIHRGDDGAGPRLIDKLRGQTSLACEDGGLAPENYLEKIVRLRPDTVVLVDCVQFDAEPGALRLFTAAELAGGGLSTHALSLRMACEYLQSRINVRILILAIQPQALDWWSGLSDPVSQTLDRLSAFLIAQYPRQSVHNQPQPVAPGGKA